PPHRRNPGARDRVVAGAAGAGRGAELASVSAVIAFLRGRLLEQQPNRPGVDVQGVGYEVHVPLSTFYVAGEPGADVSLRVHTHVREDALALFGFATVIELQIF